MSFRTKREIFTVGLSRAKDFSLSLETTACLSHISKTFVNYVISNEERNLYRRIVARKRFLATLKTTACLSHISKTFINYVISNEERNLYRRIVARKRFLAMLKTTKSPY